MLDRIHLAPRARSGGGLPLLALSLLALGCDVAPRMALQPGQISSPSPLVSLATGEPSCALEYRLLPDGGPTLTVAPRSVFESDRGAAIEVTPEVAQAGLLWGLPAVGLQPIYRRGWRLMRYDTRSPPPAPQEGDGDVSRALACLAATPGACGGVQAVEERRLKCGRTSLMGYLSEGELRPHDPETARALASQRQDRFGVLSVLMFLGLPLLAGVVFLGGVYRLVHWIATRDEEAGDG